MAEPMDPAEIGRLGRSAVDKVDLYGTRGLTLLSMHEIEALVVIAVLSGLLMPHGTGEAADEIQELKSRRTDCV